MRQNEIKKIIRHLLKDDLDIMPDCYTEWENNCHLFKIVEFYENDNIKKMRKCTYHEVCREVIEEAVKEMPKDVKKRSEEDIKNFCKVSACCLYFFLIICFINMYNGFG